MELRLAFTSEFTKHSQVREWFCWEHCREDVEKWCTMCAATKGPTTRLTERIKQYNVRALFERFAIDVA